MARKQRIDPFALNQIQTQTQTVAALSTQGPSGVMVSPGRYVDLSGKPLTQEQRIRASIQRAMRQAHFKYQSAHCENLIYECIQTARHYRAHPHVSFNGKKLTRLSFGTRRPNNRNQEGIRFYFIGRLWYAWCMGTGKKPEVNNRRNPDLPFVQFVKSIGPWFGLGNVIKNLERYQSYRRATINKLTNDVKNTADSTADNTADNAAASAV